MYRLDKLPHHEQRDRLGFQPRECVAIFPWREHEQTEGDCILSDGVADWSRVLARFQSVQNRSQYDGRERKFPDPCVMEGCYLLRKWSNAEVEHDCLGDGRRPSNRARTIRTIHPAGKHCGSVAFTAAGSRRRSIAAGCLLVSVNSITLHASSPPESQA